MSDKKTGRFYMVDGKRVHESDMPKTEKPAKKTTKPKSTTAPTK